MACADLHVRPDPNNWSEYPNVWGEVEGLIYGCDWFRIYDFIERVYYRFQKRDKKLAADFEQALNDFFIEQGIGWHMADGEIVTRGTEAFEATVNVAVESLDAAGCNTARDEIHEALADLSRRPKPDLTGAIQHGMAALECVARDACGDPKATLGDILKRHPDLIPKPLDTAIEKAWGYASEMGRHIREGRQPDRKDAEHIVKASMATIGRYFVERLKKIFPGVVEKPGVLRNSTNNPLYLLCFAASNVRGAEVALRIAGHLLKDLR